MILYVKYYLDEVFVILKPTTDRGGRDGYSSDFNGNRGGHYHPYQRHNNYQHADLRHRLDTLVPGQNIS